MRQPTNGVINLGSPLHGGGTVCRLIQYIPRNMHTVFALLCFVVVIHWLIFPYPSGLLHWHCGNLTKVQNVLYTGVDFFFASKATLMNMDKYFMWIHYERLHNHNKAKHNKTVCIFLGIYCIWAPSHCMHHCKRVCCKSVLVSCCFATSSWDFFNETFKHLGI